MAGGPTRFEEPTSLTGEPLSPRQSPPTMPRSRDRSISPTYALATSQHSRPAGPNHHSSQAASDQQETAPQSNLAVALEALALSHSPTSSLYPTDQNDQPLSSNESPPTIVVTSTTTKPIRIPPPYTPLLAALDPNRVPTITPLTARGDRKGFYYPFPSSPSPQDRRARAHSDSYRDYSPPYSPDERRRRASISSLDSLMFAMHNDQYPGRYTPTSPLSPQMPSSSHPMSHQSSKRSPHPRQGTRNMHMTLPRFHPMAYPHHGQAASPSSSTQSPAIAVTGVNGTQSIDSPRMMRQKHREFIDSAKAMSAQAASPASNKPTSPRLDPLGSPKGPVTPLALEEGGDYFTVKRVGKPSPVASPGPTPNMARSDGPSGRDDLVKNKRKVDIYR